MENSPLLFTHADLNGEFTGQVFSRRIGPGQEHFETMMETLGNSIVGVEDSLRYNSKMIAETIPELREPGSLSPDQKIFWLRNLWRGGHRGDGHESDPALVQALRERLEFDRQHPDDVSTWEAVCGRIVSSGTS
jgi:hypothetical protein